VISDALDAKIREQAGNRCGYCLAHQDYIPWVLEVEHILPKSKGGKTTKKIFGLPVVLVTSIRQTKLRGLIP
jgi:hypothetical protein